jgi:hypothetical protein
VPLDGVPAVWGLTAGDRRLFAAGANGATAVIVTDCPERQLKAWAKLGWLSTRKSVGGMVIVDTSLRSADSGRRDGCGRLSRRNSEHLAAAASLH